MSNKCKYMGCRTFEMCSEAFYYSDGKSIRRSLAVRKCTNCGQKQVLDESRFGSNYRSINRTSKTWTKLKQS